jgi:predicted dehydrogenase
MPPNPPRKLTVAVAGAGLIGRRHIELIAASPSCALAAIVDPAPGAADIARNAGVPLYTTLDELFARSRPDGVIIATPNQFHVANALACVEAGVAALVEKPVAPTVEEGERLCEAAERADAKVLVGHHRAHSPIMAKARAIVQEGTLGSLVAAMGSAMFYKPDHYFDEGPWRRQAGGGPILINMIHEIGSLRSLCGEIIAVQAFASTATRGFPVEDTVAINLRFASGALGSFLLSDTAASARSWEQTSQENKSYPTYPDEDCYLIVGTAGSLAIPTMRLKVYDRKEDRSWWKPFRTAVAEVDRTDPLELQLEHFCDVIRGEAKPLVTARDGLQNLRVTEAIALAARTGQPVSIEVPK